LSGLTSYHAGLSAEAIVQKDYETRGLRCAQQRWRGKAGEIDLIFREGSSIVFVEVKKSITHAKARARLLPQQIQRLYAAGAEFLEREPSGQLTECRFDLATVDNTGRLQIIENVIGH
jgi:putative endonuclease